MVRGMVLSDNEDGEMDVESESDDLKGGVWEG